MPPLSLSFSHHQIHFLYKELQNALLGWELTNCYAESLYKFLLVFKSNLLEKGLFFSFEKPFIRFHLVHDLRKYKKNFIHPLAEKLIPSILDQITVLPHDRIIQFQFSHLKKSRSFIAEFFPKHPNYYLVDEKREILLSLYPTKHQVYVPPVPSKLYGEKNNCPLFLSGEIEKKYDVYEKEYSFHKEKQTLAIDLQKQKKTFLHRIKKINEELEHSYQWENLQHKGELLKAHFSALKKGMKEIQLWDWSIEQEVTIEIDPLKSPQEQLKECYKKSKKLYLAISHLQNQIEKYNKKVELISQTMILLTTIQTKKELQILQDKWQKNLFIKPLKSVPIPSKPYLEFTSATGMKIWVGKNAKNNEKLTFSLANGLDWWLHTEGYPGSHIIIKTKKGTDPDTDTIQDAIQLALFYSKAKEQGEASVCITQRKYVSRMGNGRIGQVQISKHKNIYAKIDLIRYQSLKERRDYTK